MIRAATYEFTCEKDGHLILVLPRWDIDNVSVSGRCGRCDLRFGPVTFTDGYPIRGLMETVQKWEHPPR